MLPVVRLADLIVVTCPFTILWAVHTYIRYRRVVQRLNYLIGPHTLLSKPSLTTFLLPEIPFINTKPVWPWYYKWSSKHVVAAYDFLPDLVRHTSSLSAIWPRYYLPLHNLTRAGGACEHCRPAGN